jgi:RNA polymerase sigma-70 factor (ECF subfamily)
MSEAEEELIARAICGDEDALCQLLERHGAAVRRRLESRIPHASQSMLSADDLMQETYVDVFLEIRCFVLQGPGSFHAWLSKIAERNLIDALRMLQTAKRGGGRQKVEPANRNESTLALWEKLSGSGTTPSHAAARVEARHRLEAAIQRLPSHYRQVVEEYDLDGRPIEEVAALLDRSPAAVYMLRARAHRLLAELLGSSSAFLSDSA